MDILEPSCAANSIGVANPLMIHLVTTLISAYCNTSYPELWPEDYGPTAIDVGQETYDFIVIGAGSAGAVVAKRLAEDPNQKVLLIEAGGDPPIESDIPGLHNTLQGTKFDWSYPTVTNNKSCLAANDNTCIFPRGKMLGGSSSINGMLYSRGTARDYDEWEQLGNPSWDSGTVMKYFKYLENFKGTDRNNVHGRDGPVSVEPFRATVKDQKKILKASVELQQKQVADFVDGNYLGFGFLYGTVKDGRRFSTAKAYLIEELDNLYIIKNAVAKKINFNANKEVDSVTIAIQANDDTKELTMHARKEVIVSAGSIESAKLLMLSGIGPRPHLSRLGIPVLQPAAVGDNLQDHLAVPLFLRLEEQASANEFSILDGIYDQWIHQVGPLGVGVLNVGAFVNTKKSASKYPDIQYIYLSIASFSKFGERYKPAIRQSITHQLGPRDRVMVVFVTLLKPKSRGRIRLASNDYKDKPIIYHNFLNDEQDVETLVRGINQQLDFEYTDTFRKWNAKFLKVDLPDCDIHSYGSYDYWRCYSQHFGATVHHQVGTIKMGPSNDTYAVVDHHLRVRGVTGLRVIDASIMPTIISGNTNAPSIMIGEKGADYVKSSWKMRPMFRMENCEEP